MKRTNYLILSILPILLLIAACTSPETDGLSEDDRVETRAAEIIKATADFELAVEQEVAARSTEEAANNPPTEPPATSTAAPPPTTEPDQATPTAVSAESEPTAVPTDSDTTEAQPTPTLFPLVKQGAPGDRQGIEGNIFAPDGLQISSDPAVYGERISFMALGLFDTNVGEQEGDGVKTVTFTITDANGKIVHRLVEETPFFCAFGGSSPCAEWDFSQSDNKWPSGEAATSGQHNAQIEASGSENGRFSIWTYDFELDLGDGGNANLPEPTPTLFPLVKQGAPGDRQGIEGSIFAPEGLQISADPAVYGQRISFLLVGAFDENAGTAEGDGVSSVTFTIFDNNGDEVYKKEDSAPFYCAFSGDNPCTIWDFSQNDNKWPDGTAAQSGNYNAQIEAKGTDTSRFSIWTYDFSLDLGDAKPEPTPTLFPVVKQGAPSQKDGILGNVYAPAGLQISSDPAIFGNQISFMLLDSYDETTGSTEEGAGIAKVTFTVKAPNGNVVYTRSEETPLFCAFGGDNPCNVWNFSANGNKWPSGEPVYSGDYSAVVNAVGKDGGESNWNYDFAIDVGDVQPAPTPTEAAAQTPKVTITNITLNGDRYSVDFVASGYQPALPGMHMHFFFETVPAEQAGAPGGGPWQIYPNTNGGAASSPMTLYGVNDRPSGANQLCVLVANANHSVNLGTGNCYPLP
ncbi:MAG: hypothetical protein AB8G95_13555 [Anaerolineae bacterium]